MKKNIKINSFGDLILWLIKEKGQSQKSFAIDIGVDPSTITNWVRYGKAPGQDRSNHLRDTYFELRGDLYLQWNELYKKAKLESLSLNKEEKEKRKKEHIKQSQEHIFQSSDKSILAEDALLNSVLAHLRGDIRRYVDDLMVWRAGHENASSGIAIEFFSYPHIDDIINRLVDLSLDGVHSASLSLSHIYCARQLLKGFNVRNHLRLKPNISDSLSNREAVSFFAEIRAYALIIYSLNTKDDYITQSDINFIISCTSNRSVIGTLALQTLSDLTQSYATHSLPIRLSSNQIEEVFRRTYDGEKGFRRVVRSLVVSKSNIPDDLYIKIIDNSVNYLIRYGKLEYENFHEEIIGNKIHLRKFLSWMECEVGEDKSVMAIVCARYGYRDEDILKHLRHTLTEEDLSVFRRESLIYLMTPYKEQQYTYISRLMMSGNHSLHEDMVVIVASYGNWKRNIVRELKPMRKHIPTYETGLIVYGATRKISYFSWYIKVTLSMLIGYYYFLKAMIKQRDIVKKIVQEGGIFMSDKIDQVENGREILKYTRTFLVITSKVVGDLKGSFRRVKQRIMK